MKKTLLAFASLLALSACGYATEARPDHRVGVVTDAETGKLIAVPHTCPMWHQHWGDGLENHLTPQYSCYDYYNLAKQVERPADLVQGHAPGSAEAIPGILGIERYRENKTTPLINPKEIPTTNGGSN